MILFLFFLAALDLFNRFYFFVFAASIVFLLTPYRKVRMNRSVMMLAILGLATLVFNSASHSSILNMIKPFSYMFAYVIGVGLFQNRNRVPVNLIKEETRVSSVIYVVAGGSALHFLLNMVTNWETVKRDEMIDFWTKSEMAATGQAAMACLAIGVAIAFLFSRVGKLKKTIGVFTIALIVVYNLILAGRTLFVFLAIEILAALIYLRAVEKKTIRAVVIVVLILVILVTVLFTTDAFGIKTAYEQSNFYFRFFGSAYSQEINEDSRLEYKLGHLERFFDHMWGDGKIREDFGHHAHDLYLDTYDQSGIFALIAVCVYMIASVIRAAKCALNRQFSLPLRMLVFCTYLICNVQFWIEPIPDGMPWLFAAYCFIDGAVTYLLHRYQEGKSIGFHVTFVESTDSKET